MMTTLLRKLIDETRSRAADRPPLIGVSGAQGSGKSYRCKQFAAANPRVAHFSLDDVYYTRAERESRARSFFQAYLQDPPQRLHELDPLTFPKFTPSEREAVKEKLHPLLITRGPPGTHDIGLAQGLIARLRTSAATPLPRFDKARDERAPEETWPLFAGPAEAILIDGWCLGATPPEDGDAINAVDREDAHGMWRRHVRSELATNYAAFFAAFDAIVHLKAPSWEIVKRWRAEQEVENLGRALTPEDHARLERFMQHYERITRHMLAGGHCADWVVELDERRSVVRLEARAP